MNKSKSQENLNPRYIMGLSISSPLLKMKHGAGALKKENYCVCYIGELLHTCQVHGTKAQPTQQQSPYMGLSCFVHDQKRILIQTMRKREQLRVDNFAPSRLTYPANVGRELVRFQPYTMGQGGDEFRLFRPNPPCPMVIRFIIINFLYPKNAI